LAAGNGFQSKVDAASIGAFADEDHHSRADDLLEVAKVVLWLIMRDAEWYADSSSSVPAAEGCRRIRACCAHTAPGHEVRNVEEQCPSANSNVPTHVCDRDLMSRHRPGDEEASSLIFSIMHVSDSHAHACELKSVRVTFAAPDPSPRRST